jgi:glycosyltransferase involved in cell wall biosynthesis
MRIGMIAPPWLAIPPWGYGGIEAVIDLLAEALVAAGHEVLLAASSDSTCAVTRLPGFAPSDPAVLGSTVAELRHALLAHRELHAAGVDVIHDHTLIGPHLPRSSPRTPIITTVHGPFDDTLGPIVSGLPPHVGIVAISHFQAHSMRGVPVRRVIHHGVEPDRIPIGDGDGGYACFLGRMSPDKGVREAIEVARRADMPLKIAAKMKDKAEGVYFAAEVKPFLGPSCEFLGELNAADKYALLGGATAMVNPIAWDEPFGMVMIESLATGTPVLTTSRGSAPEIVDDGRTGFVRNSINALVASLLDIDSLDRAACRAITTTQFSARRMAADYAQVFAEALEREGAAGTAGPPDGPALRPAS